MTDTSTTAGQANSDREPEFIFVERPRCPLCGSRELKTYRSTSHDDGTRERHARCVSCGQRSRLIIE